ncbi:uncharacterized protein [Clytia hemisphaerica]|uniref:uncharacterized protein isoform X2 n=1 Tax=Clytia hemisphaerica TaxID=252671 RepID=UPI0034D611CE
MYICLIQTSKQMVVQSMAFSSIEAAHQKGEGGNMINDILQKIQQSSKETCLWGKPCLEEKRTDCSEAVDKQTVLKNIEAKDSFHFDDFWEELALLDNEASVDDDVNNNNFIDQGFSMCLESNEELPIKTEKRRGTRLVRRQSSVDSGIVVRTPSESYQDRLALVKSRVKRCKTTDNALSTLQRSNSLPNLKDIDLNKFQTIKFKDFKAYKKEQQDSKIAAESAKKHSEARKKHKDLFSIRNYTRGKYRKTKLSELITRNNTFSMGEGRMPPHKLNGRPLFEDSLEENYVLSFDIDSTDTKGDTCLHHASSIGDVDTVRYLLKEGGNVWRKNNNKLLPMELSHDFKTAKLLSHATIFYTEPEKQRHGCNNISSTVKLAFDL